MTVKPSYPPALLALLLACIAASPVAARAQAPEPVRPFTIHIPDSVYEGVERRALAHGATVGEEIVTLLERSTNGHEETVLTAARARMAELFRTVKGFRQSPRIPREELYERGSIR